jgi:hypothetical protein
MYVVSSFGAEVLANDFGFFAPHQYVRSVAFEAEAFEAEALADDFGLFVSNQDVCGVIL